jgi:hypothetical protein
MVAGAIAATYFALPDIAPLAASGDPLSAPNIIAAAFCSVALVLVLRAGYLHYQASTRWHSPWKELLKANRWRPSLAMAVLGITGGLLYATAGKWTYLAVLSDRSAGLVRTGGAQLGSMAVIISIALFTGGLVAAYLSGRLALRTAERGILPRRFAGGAFMSGAAAILPGGNDALLLYGMPSLVPYAFVGYAAMIASLCVIVWLERQFRIRLSSRVVRAPTS